MNPPDESDASHEVYEIKSEKGVAAGRAQLALYLGILNDYLPTDAIVRWHPGFTYSPPSEVSGFFGRKVRVSPPEDGIITYQPMDPNNLVEVTVVSALGLSAAATTMQYLAQLAHRANEIKWASAETTRQSAVLLRR